MIVIGILSSFPEKHVSILRNISGSGLFSNVKCFLCQFYLKSQGSVKLASQRGHGFLAEALRLRAATAIACGSCDIAKVLPDPSNPAHFQDVGLSVILHSCSAMCVFRLCDASSSLWSIPSNPLNWCNLL